MVATQIWEDPILSRLVKVLLRVAPGMPFTFLIGSQVVSGRVITADEFWAIFEEAIAVSDGSIAPLPPPRNGPVYEEEGFIYLRDVVISGPSGTFKAAQHRLRLVQVDGWSPGCHSAYEC